MKPKDNKSRRQSRKNQSVIPGSHATATLGIIRVPQKVSSQKVVRMGGWGSTRTTFTSTNAAEGNYSMTFSIAEIADYSSLANVFDAYRIVSVQYVISPLSQPVTASTILNGAELVAVVDYDDDNTASFSVLSCAQGAALINQGKSLEFNFKPRIAMAAYQSGAFSAYTTMPAQWIDFNSPSTPHYALKVAVGNQLSSAIYHAWFGRAYYTYEVRYRR